MKEMSVTILLALGVFFFFVLALSLGRLFGRTRKRRCACAESKRVFNLVMEREKAAKKAALYRPDQVNPNELPILSPNLVESRKTD